MEGGRAERRPERLGQREQGGVLWGAAGDITRSLAK